MTDAVAVIKTEHRNLMRVVNTFDAVMRGVESGGAPDFALLEAIVEYLRTFTDRHHHPKEDRFLFASLRERSADAHAILDELEAEHSQCYAATEALAEALDAYRFGGADGRARFAEAAKSYRHLQLRHLQKEEGVVIPMARAALQPEDWERINAAFADNKDPLFSAEAQEDARSLYSRIVNLAPAPWGLADA